MFDFLSDFASSLPVVGSMVKSSDEQNMQAQYARNQQLWQQMLDNYKGPEDDPEYKNQLAGLAQQANGGLNPADKAAMLDAYSQASQMARGREGALEQQSQMRGGGVANSGQLLAAQQGASQAGAQRAQSAGMQQAGIASQRALQARQGYLNTVENNKAALNRYRMAATGGMTGANSQMADYFGASDASRKGAMQHYIDTGVNAVFGKGTAPAAASSGGGGGSYTGGGSANPDYPDYYSSIGGGF